MSTNVIKSELNPTNQYRDNSPTEIAFDLKVHFVKLEQNNQKYLSYVSFSCIYYFKASYFRSMFHEQLNYLYTRVSPKLKDTIYRRRI